MVNPWIEHVKQYAKDNNVSYGCAISEAKASYVKITKDDKKEMEKIKEDKQRKAIVKKLVVDFKNSEGPEDIQRIKTKYKRFSKGLKEFIKENSPKLHSKINE